MKIDGLTKSMINFETEISKIDLNVLSTEEIGILNLSNYQIGYFVLDRVIEIYDKKNKVFVAQDEPVLNLKMKNLICFIKGQNSNVIPPILELAGDNLIIRDGKHRIGLCWYMKINEIPFLYLKSNHLKICELLK